MRHILFTLMILITSTFVFGQVSTPSSNEFLDSQNGWTSDDAVRFGLRNNGELAAMRSELEAEKKRIEQAGQRAPISIGTDGLQQTIGKSHRYTVKGTVPLELGGRRRTRVLTAERRATVKEWDLKNRETLLASEIRSKYSVALSKALELQLVYEHLSSLERSYRLVSERVKEGKTAPLEKNMLLVEINRVKAAREKALQSVRVAIVELEKSVGRDSDLSLKLRQESSTLRSNVPLSALLDRALDGRPDLMLLKSMGDLADARIASTESKNRIDAAASLGYQRLRISETVKFNYLVFGITFKLPVADKGKAEIEAAVLDKKAVEERLSFGRLVVRQEVKKALIRYESAVKSREIYRNGVVSEAEKNLDVVRQMYEFGRYSLLDYLEEQRRVIKLKKELVGSELEVDLAGIEIDRASNAPELVVK